MSKNTKAADAYNTSLDRMLGRLNNLNKGMSRGEYNLIRKTFQQIKNDSFKSGLLGKPQVEKYVSEAQALAEATTLRKWASNNPKVVKQFGKELEDLAQSLETSGKSLKKSVYDQKQT